MKSQTYYNTPLEALANICDTTKELCINCAGAVEDSGNISTRSVRRDYYLIYVIEGSMEIEFDAVKSTITAGNLLVLEPETKYFYHTKKGGRINYLWMHFTGKNANTILKSFSIPLNSICNCGQIGSVTECWKKMFREFVLNDEHFDKITAALFTEVLTIFSRNLTKSDKSNFLKSIMYIHENYHKNLTIAHLASIENLSVSHYRMLFVKATGKSPVEYITERRISAAIEMLENSDKPLSEIAELVGYNDVYYFGRVFKKKIGISPGRYRKNSLQ